MRIYHLKVLCVLLILCFISLHRHWKTFKIITPQFCTYNFVEQQWTVGFVEIKTWLLVLSVNMWLPGESSLLKLLLFFCGPFNSCRVGCSDGRCCVDLLVRCLLVHLAFCVKRDGELDTWVLQRLFDHLQVYFTVGFRVTTLGHFADNDFAGAQEFRSIKSG